MNQQRAPWFLGFATVAALIFSRGSLGPPAPSPSAPAGQNVSQSGPQPKTAWAAYVRVYDDFFGIAPLGGKGTQQLRGTWAEQRIDLRLSSAEPVGDGSEPDLDPIKTAAKDGGYMLDFLVALVPDPIDSRLPSNFDFTLAGLQMGLNRAGFLFDRGWLPWTAAASAGGDADGRPAHHTAGIMLFRNEPKPPEKTTLLAVFLVGETPKGGIHRLAFRQAVRFIDRLNALVPVPATPQDHPHGCLGIRVLGPSFSGSAESLRTEMSALKSGLHHGRFCVVSGSATASWLKDYFANDPTGAPAAYVSFARTVVSDDDLTGEAFCFLQKHLGWDLTRTALLIEGDTAYGKSFASPSGQSSTTGSGDSRGSNRGPSHSPGKSGPGCSPLTTLQFPSGLSAIRNAWEETSAGVGIGKATGMPREPGVGLPKTALEISLADRGTPADSILELSPLTSRIEEMALASLLRTIPRKGIRYVGIVATDVKDEVFIVEQVRRWAPDVTLVLFESNLIYVHPHFHSALFGSLVVTSFPMLTNEVTPLLQTGKDTEPVVQFGSETQKGVFLATQCLLGRSVEPPAVWIAASGNDTLSPVAWRPVVSSSLGTMCSAALPPDPDAKPKVIFFPEGNDLQLFFALVALCILAHWFGEHVYLQKQPSDGGGSDSIGTRLLLILGEAVLLTLGTWIAVLALLPLHPHAWPLFDQGATPLRRGLHLFLLAMTALAYLILLRCMVAKVAQSANGFLGRKTPWRHRMAIEAATALGGFLLCWALAECLLGAWNLEQPAGFLYLRVRRFANGLSPLVSLAWLGAALFVWISVELRRQQLRARHHLDLSIAVAAEPALSGCQRHLEEIKGLLGSTLPASRRFWLLVGVAIVPTAALVWKITQPLADPREYGRVFIALVLVAFVLSVVSFYRFGATWLRLRHFLGRLEHCRCRRSFASIAGLVKWDPMKSFVWYTPSFKTVGMSVEWLEELARGGLASVAKGSFEATRQLQAVFEAEAKGSFSSEVAARRNVSRMIDRAGRHLTDQGRDPEVQALFALRVVGYLRHVFIQLRYALMGAMAPALLLIVALSSYTFVPSRLILLLVWTALLIASAASLVVFVQMDRDMVLSEIGNHSPGSFLDRAFLSNIFTYAILPLLALVSSQLPGIGQIFGHWLDPLNRLLEVG